MNGVIVNGLDKKYLFSSRSILIEYAALYPNMECFDNFDYELENLNKIYDKIFLFLLNNNVVAIICVIKNNNFIELRRLYVKKQYRNKKIALNLMNCVFDYAKDNNVKTIGLETMKTMKEAISLYQKLNFKIIAEYPSFLEMECKIF